MSAQCRHGVLRYECPKCDRAREKREKGMNYGELVRRLRSGCAPDVCPDERDEAADAILALRADRDSQQRGFIRAMEDLAAARADAERYRWLRKVATPPTLAGIAWGNSEAACKFSDPDAAIDAALAGEKK